jgi:Fe-S cluster biogenesis protein NfuA
MTNKIPIDIIEDFIYEKIAPGVWAHEGEIRITKYENNILELYLSGACGSCSVQAYTVDSLTDYVLEEFPDLDDVVVVIEEENTSPFVEVLPYTTI